MRKVIAVGFAVFGLISMGIQGLMTVPVQAQESTAFAPDYFPVDRETFCKRIYEQTFGDTGQDTLEIVGSTTAPYTTQPLTGSLICNIGEEADPPEVWHNDGVTFKSLMSDNFYVSIDCDMSEHPPSQAFGLVHDGEILSDAGVVEVSKDLSDCQAGDPNERLLIQIQDLTLRGKPFNNAVLVWGLSDDLPFVPLDFQGKDLDLGITLPALGDTGGRAVDDFTIFGVGEGIIAGGGHQ